MPKTPKVTKKSALKATAHEIAEMASRGEDISVHFTNKFTLVKPVRRGGNQNPARAQAENTQSR